MKMKRKIAWAIAGYFFIGHILAMVPILECHLPQEITAGVHTDYYFELLQLVPRWLTSRCFSGPPIMLMGNQEYWAMSPNGIVGPKPIPRRGEWQLSLVKWRRGWPFMLPYFAFTTYSGLHFRAGTRWDDVNHYYTYPSLAIKLAE